MKRENSEISMSDIASVALQAIPLGIDIYNLWAAPKATPKAGDSYNLHFNPDINLAFNQQKSSPVQKIIRFMSWGCPAVIGLIGKIVPPQGKPVVLIGSGLLNTACKWGLDKVGRLF